MTKSDINMSKETFGLAPIVFNSLIKALIKTKIIQDMPMKQMGREGYFDDTKPTMKEQELLSLENNESKDQGELYSGIKAKHYKHMD